MPDSEAAVAVPLAAAFTIGRFRGFARRGLLLLLLAAELFHFGIPLLPNLNPTLRAGWWWPIIFDGRPIAEAMLGGLFIAIFLSWPAFCAAFNAAIHDGVPSRLNFWLAVHLLCVTMVAGWLACGMRPIAFSPIGGATWFFAGLILLPATVITWSAAIIPRIFWTRWLTQSPSALALGAVVGILARSAGYFTQMLWPPLREYTFVLVDLMLHALGLPVVSDPGTALLGTAHFAVIIAPACSGLEGIALICAFIAAYLWFYRAEYRFPAALALVPAGIAIIWLLNAVRITALILLGQWYGEVALAGFHSVAGWIFFNLTAFGVVTASRHVGWIIRTNETDVSRESIHESNPALPYLLPLLLTIGVAMLTAPFAAGFDAAYPVRVIVVGLALWWYRDRIGTALSRFPSANAPLYATQLAPTNGRSYATGISWKSVGTTLGLNFGKTIWRSIEESIGGSIGNILGVTAGPGILCATLWIVLTPRDHTADAAIAGHLRNLPTVALITWTLFRVAGAVITVPLAEELAFRGYLLRKLIGSNFESVPFETFTWLSFIVSSVAFGALHQSWTAGTLAGAIFALAMHRRGRLADAVAAHAIANALLALYVIATGSWSLWT